MTSKELVQVWGSDKAKHLIIGHSGVKNWQGQTEDRVFGEGMEYGVWSQPGASLLQLLEGLEAILARIPGEDKDRRTVIVQVIIKLSFNNIYQFF